MARPDDWYLICRVCGWSVRVTPPKQFDSFAQERPRIPEWAQHEFIDHWVNEHADGTARQTPSNRG